MDADTALGALMMQLQNAAGVAQDADDDQQGNRNQQSTAGGPDDADDSDSGSDIMAELRALKRDPEAAAQEAAAAAAAPISKAVAAANTAALLLHQATRRHVLFLMGDAAVARESDRQRFANGEMAADEASQWELNEALFSSQEATAAAEYSTAAAPNGTASLRPASSAAMSALGVINRPETCRDAGAWRTLLAEMRELPLSRSRPLWQRCAALFPRQTEVVNDYLVREIEAEAAAVRSEDAVITRLRILDTFHRHLPLCITSAKLHVTLLKYTAETAGVDDFTVKDIGETAIRRVGRCLDASPLWRYMLDDVMPRFRRQPDYIDRVRALYHAWLSTPMDGLEDAGFAYGAFETSLRAQQRIRLETKLEERFKRARALYFDKAKLWAALDPNFLPGVSVRPDGTMCRAAVTQWRVWSTILAEEADAAKQGLPPVAHSHRLAFVLKQRLSCFPDVQLCWLDLARHAMASNLNELADAVFTDATTNPDHFPQSVMLHQQHAHLLSSALNAPERANGVFASLLRGLIAEINTVLKGVRSSASQRPTQKDFDKLSRVKADMAGACCAWMSWARHSLREHGVSHARAVAEHAVKRCQMARSAVFLHHWLEFELECGAPQATGPDAAPADIVAACPPAVVLNGWLRAITTSMANAHTMLIKRLGEARPNAMEAAYTRMRRRGARTETSSESLSRAQLAGVADTVISYGLRAAAMVQSAACVVPEALANDDMIQQAFRQLVLDVGANGQAVGDAAACVSVLHAAGLNDEAKVALDHGCRRLPPLAATVRAQLEATPLLLPAVSQWVLDTTAEVLEGSDGVSASNIATLVKSRMAALRSFDAAAGSDTAELASRISLGGLIADEQLLSGALYTVDAAVPPRANGPAGAAARLTPEDATDVTNALQRAMRRVVPTPGTWNTLLGGHSGIRTPRSAADATDAAVAASLLSGGPQSAATSKRRHRNATAGGDGDGDAAVTVLAPHGPARIPAAAAGGPGGFAAEVDTRRWTRLPEVPANTEALAGSAAVRSFKSHMSGGDRGGPQQRGAGAVDGAVAGGVRIVSADDVLSKMLERQELVLPSADDDEAVARKRALEEKGRTLRHVYTAQRIATAGAGSSLLLASMPPQQLQQEQLASSLTRLIRALPTAAGCVGKFDPFIADHIPALYEEHLAGVKGGTEDGAGDDDGAADSKKTKKTRKWQSRPLVPGTEFVMRSLASATTLTLHEL